MTRCSGQCCRALSLPYSPAELADMRTEAVKSILRLVEIVPDKANLHLAYADILHTQHLKYLGFGLCPLPREDRAERHWYRCTLQAENGDCSVYDTRPPMCRRYPRPGHPCLFVGCTHEGTAG